jgi:hypothetical protein
MSSQKRPLTGSGPSSAILSRASQHFFPAGRRNALSLCFCFLGYSFFTTRSSRPNRNAPDGRSAPSSVYLRGESLTTTDSCSTPARETFVRPFSEGSATA